MPLIKLINVFIKNLKNGKKFEYILKIFRYENNKIIIYILGQSKYNFSSKLYLS